MVDIIVALVILAILALAVGYIYHAKKNGAKCIGCPAAGSCASCKGHSQGETQCESQCKSQCQGGCACHSAQPQAEHAGQAEQTALCSCCSSAQTKDK